MLKTYFIPLGLKNYFRCYFEMFILQDCIDVEHV